MAIKPDREEITYDTNWFMDEVAEPGGVVVASTYASGGYPGNAAATVTYAANPSGKRPVGVLMSTVKDIDETHQHLNPYAEEIQKGGKPVLVTRGSVTTNMVTGTIAGGDSAYLGPSGLWTNVQASGAPGALGFFATTVNEEGYTRIRFSF